MTEQDAQWTQNNAEWQNYVSFSPWIHEALGKLSIYPHFPSLVTSLLWHGTSHKHRSFLQQHKEQRISSATNSLVLLTSFAGSAGLYNKQNSVLFLSCFMQTYTNSMFQAFLDVFSPVFFVSFILPMGCQINGEKLWVIIAVRSPQQKGIVTGMVCDQACHSKISTSKGTQVPPRSRGQIWQKISQESESQKETKSKIVKVPQLW